MSYLTPLSALELDLRETKSESKNSKSNSMSPLKINELPKWLLEFNSFSINDSKLKSETNARPLTESSVGQRPQWFRELAQQRRSSEVFTSIEPKCELFCSNEQKFDESIRKKSRRSDDKKDIMNKNNKITKSFVSIPKEMNNYFEPIMKSKSFGKTFKSCEDLLIENIEVDDSLIDFIIPELPSGQLLVFEIITNWGDEDYVGLNGIEVIDLNQTQLKVEKVWSEPQTDRNLNALIDGKYRTHDDSSIWLTPLTSKTRLPLKIYIKFESIFSMALLRIWNYNKSRIYSYRGIKFLSIRFDNRLIFRGEIAKASGTLIGPIEAFGDTILFTTDDTILESVALRDQSFQELVNEIIPLTQQ